MIDILDLIVERGGNPELVRQALQKRQKDEKIVDEVILLWHEAYKARYRVQQARTQANHIQKDIGQIKSSKKDPTTLLTKKSLLEAEINSLEREAIHKEQLRDEKCKKIPNYLHESVPINKSEDFNEVVAIWAPEGARLQKKDCFSHHEVMTRTWPFADFARGAKIVGHRGYFLRKWGVFFNQALINHGLHFLHSKGYDPIQPPFFMKSNFMSKTAQLEDFEESLYKIEGDKDLDSESKYLIATSEQPLSAMYADEWMTEKDLPQKLAGYSTCFRKEAGSHGRDAWGLFRVHQFEKGEQIEQFLFVRPEDSWQSLEDMRSTSEEFYQSLGLPYRVVAIVSGGLNNAAAKKYDLEAWFPHQGEYKELVSCTNCTDYQTRELNIRYRAKDATTDSGARKTYCHALNGTLCATERTMCCIMENYQTDQGVVVPEVLKPYMPPGTPDLIPFTGELSRNGTFKSK